MPIIQIVKSREIEPGIKNLIKELRALGVEPIASCEGHPGRYGGDPYVAFKTKSVSTILISGDTVAIHFKKRRKKIAF